MINTQQIKRIARHSKNCFIKEYIKTKIAFQLIQKSTKSKLTLAEKKQVQFQLLELSKLIPAFLIFMLPGGSILLFFWIKFVPSMLPGSFKEF